jgi:site-specific recombinase XerD
MNFCERQLLECISQITSSDVRNFLLYLQEEGLHPGWIHISYRSLKTFHRWYDLEAAPDNWGKPILQIKAPKKTLDKDITRILRQLIKKHTKTAFSA